VESPLYKMKNPLEITRGLEICIAKKSIFAPPSRVLALYNVKRVTQSLSHLKKSLNPTVPVLPMGIFRYFWAVAYVCIGASPNEDLIVIVNDTGTIRNCQ